MSELSNKYREIMNEIDEKITDEKQLNFVKNKISEISIIFIDIIDRMSQIVDEKVIDIEKGQKNIEKKLAKVQKVIDVIEKDIYDDEFEIEIVCPYCNNEFMTEINEDEENEIECPECHNIIELDLNADIDEDNLSCSGNCSSCGGCSSEENDDEDEGDM
ncbi:MAG: hypothetical protein J6A89_02090 [Clostridia bacterium]|nr:hypothetical protein [Clostridia bacterium]